MSTAVSGVSEVLPTGLLAHPGSVTALQALLTRELPQLETLKARETELFARARGALSIAAMALKPTPST